MTILSDDFHEAYEKAIADIYKFGEFANDNSYKYSTLYVVLEGKAIKQIENKETHYLTQFKSIDDYITQIIKGENKYGFDYTYGERLNRNVENVRNLYLKEGGYSRRMILNTWNYLVDDNAIENGDGGIPCLQFIQILPNSNTLALVWRSRDLVNAWQPNIIGLYHFVRHKIPEFEISKIIDFTTCCHIYQKDVVLAERIYKLRLMRG